MNKTSTARDLSENLIIRARSLQQQLLPVSDVPRAVFQDAIQMIVELKAESAAKDAVIQDLVRVNTTQNAEYRQIAVVGLGKADRARRAR